MQAYRYRASRADGSLVEGVMQASRPEDVRAALLSRDLRVSTVNPFGKTWRDFFRLEIKAKTRDVVLFCRQLASFVSVGIPVTTALRTFAEEAHTRHLRDAYIAVVADLERGVRISDAFAVHPLVFPQILIDMIRSAEETGSLDTVLRQAAKHLEREDQARRRIRSAMTYPIIIASLAVIITTGMIVAVLPRFKDLYDSLGVPIPSLLAAVLGFSGFVSDHDLAILLSLLVVLLGSFFLVRRPAGRYWLDSALLRLPLISPAVRAATTERFCRTLGDMITAGVPIGQTFAVVVSNVRNRVFQAALSQAASALAAGEGISRPLAATGVFSPAVIQLIRVGEETGTLDTNLIQAADMHEEELDYRIKRMTAILEPALIVFVGAIVGFVAVTMISSIYSLAGGFK